jgi:hypothetical protein
MAFTAMIFKAKFRTQLYGSRFKLMLLAVWLFLGLAGLGGIRAAGGLSAFAGQAEARQESSHEAWQAEFDNICAKTEDAMTLSQDELTDLIRRCDNLQPQIEKLDESRRKVYFERLRKCRGLYAYVLDAKKDKK